MVNFGTRIKIRLGIKPRVSVPAGTLVGSGLGLI